VAVHLQNTELTEEKLEMLIKILGMAKAHKNAAIDFQFEEFGPEDK
jgi:hypothetical protein